MRWIAVLGLLIGGCTSCDRSGPAVPFGLEDGADTTATSDEPGSDGPSESEPAEGTLETFDEGTGQVTIEGATLHDDANSLRAVLSLDLDADADLDAITIRDAPARVAFHRRGDSGFGPALPLGAAPTEGCRIEAASIERLGASWLHAQATVRCVNPSGGEAEVEENGPTRTDHWIIDGDRTPRLLEHLSVLPPRDEEANETVQLELQSDDRDEDGRTDLSVTFRVEREGQHAELQLTWLDRPSGLAREPNEPGATLRERSRDALRRLRHHPEQALDRSLTVLALHEALCREPGRARLGVGRQTGLPCGPSDGAGRAAATVVRAHAALGHTQQAVVAFASMQGPGRQMSEERLTYARRALEDLPASEGLSVREGPEFAAPAPRGTQLSALGFLDEERVVLRGNAPRIWNLQSGEVTPGGDGGRRVLDPSGQLVVAEVGRSCEGFVLRVTQRGVPLSSPLIEAGPAPEGASCPLRGARAQDTGGWDVLGWAPQGVLTRRGPELRIVPLDVRGRAAGAPRPLQPGTPPPVPLPPGAIDAAGRFHVEARGLALYLHRTGSSGPGELLWPPGWGTLDGSPTHAAVSPSGRRIAVARAGHVQLIERGAQAE